MLFIFYPDPWKSYPNKYFMFYSIYAQILPLEWRVFVAWKEIGWVPAVLYLIFNQAQTGFPQLLEHLLKTLVAWSWPQCLTSLTLYLLFTTLNAIWAPKHNANHNKSYLKDWHQHLLIMTLIVMGNCFFYLSSGNLTRMRQKDFPQISRQLKLASDSVLVNVGHNLSITAVLRKLI